VISGHLDVMLRHLTYRLDWPTDPTRARDHGFRIDLRDRTDHARA